MTDIQDTLELREAVEPFVSWARDNVEADPTAAGYGIWAGNRCEGERIKDWFGPTDFYRLLAALSSTPLGKEQEEQQVGLPGTVPDDLSIMRGEAELHLLEEVCAFYADDEDAFLSGDGEPYGGIPTEVGLKARDARRRFRAREAQHRDEPKSNPEAERDALVGACPLSDQALIDTYQEAWNASYAAGGTKGDVAHAAGLRAVLALTPPKLEAETDQWGNIPSGHRFGRRLTADAVEHLLPGALLRFHSPDPWFEHREGMPGYGEIVVFTGAVNNDFPKVGPHLEVSTLDSVVYSGGGWVYRLFQFVGDPQTHQGHTSEPDKLEARSQAETDGQAAWEWLSTHPNLELSWGGYDEDPQWQVHQVRGGINDREWHLVGTADTPLEAVQQARALLQSHQGQKDGAS